MNKMLTPLSTIIERWNETCLNQEFRGQVRFKKIFCFNIFFKSLLKIILIRIIYRSAMATTRVVYFFNYKTSYVHLTKISGETKTFLNAYLIEFEIKSYFKLIKWVQYMISIYISISFLSWCCCSLFETLNSLTNYLYTIFIYTEPNFRNYNISREAQLKHKFTNSRACSMYAACMKIAIN